MKDEIKENIKIIKDWLNQYYENPEKVTSFMINQQNRIKELETINEEHCRINGELRKTINEAINYIDDNTYYKDHKGHINIDDLYVILQGKSDE